jgi:hypothetical protein
VSKVFDVGSSEALSVEGIVALSFERHGCQLGYAHRDIGQIDCRAGLDDQLILKERKLKVYSPVK